MTDLLVLMESLRVSITEMAELMPHIVEPFHSENDY
jgi:hypothetical protein